jgi:VanZ family protein
MSTRPRPVLLGGRSLPHRRGPVGHVLFVWGPVIVMLLVIARESTAAFGSVNTSHIFRAVYEALFGRVSDSAWEHIHHHIRKTGHFLGYGTLGLSWLRAFLYRWMALLRHRSATIWRRWSLQMAICCTALVVSLDEVHQSYIPDRTGVVTDVLLDTSGALAMCLLFAVFWLRRSVRAAAFEEAAAGPAA